MSHKAPVMTLRVCRLYGKRNEPAVTSYVTDRCDSGINLLTQLLAQKQINVVDQYVELFLQNPFKTVFLN